MTSREKYNEYQRRWMAAWRLTPEGKLKNTEASRLWRSKHPEEHRIRNRKYAKEHRKEINQKLRARYKNDSLWKIQCLLRSRMKDSWNNSSLITNSAYRDFLGCSINDLKTHLESQFKSGMTWGNQGEWHIDHAIPLSLFAKLRKDGTEEFFDLYLEDAFNYTNLRPEWGKENCRRGDRWTMFNPLLVDKQKEGEYTRAAPEI